MTTQGNIVIPKEIEELIVKFDSNRNLFSKDWKIGREIDKEREEFVSLFQINKISEIRLENYVEGKPDIVTGEPNRTTFCYLLEHTLNSFGGIGGGAADKFGIYFSKGDKDYRYEKNRFKTVEEAFIALKQDLQVIIEAGNIVEMNGNWEEFSKIVDDSDFQIHRHVISKILVVYFSSIFVSIHSNDAINSILEFFKISQKEMKWKLQLKKSILNDLKDNHPIMKNWNYQDYSHFLWEAIVKSNEPISAAKILHVKISKGSSNPSCEETNSCYSPNVIKIEIGDIVTWENEDNANHSIVSGESFDRPSVIFQSDTITERNTFSHKFENGGTYHYFDGICPWMKGQVIVGSEEIIQEAIDETIDDSPLKFPSKEKLDDGVQEILKDLLIDPETIKEIVINLASGRHILLAGPIGTGKTQLALRIPKIFWTENNDGYYPELYTATSEWSPNDVIGGIIPKMKNGEPIYDVQLGCVSMTAKNNWDKNNLSKRILTTHNDKTYQGTWLVIDEFNRAEIDKAMGHLFTSLETKTIKIPTSKVNKDFEEVRIPKDYRIIGTLNTADKHYLFKLSDALKRRFAYIEVLAPTIEQKDQEIYVAMKNALGEFEHEDLESMIVLDKENKKIDDNSNQEFLKRVNSAYDILAFIRTIKPLGTAVLKSIYQTLVVGSSITHDLNRSLDSAINVNLIPQLENTQINSLELILAFFFDDPIDFFKKKLKSSTVLDKYDNEFKIFLEFIRIQSPETKIESFKKGNIEENVWDSIQKKYDYKKTSVELPMFKTSLKELIKTSSML